MRISNAIISIDFHEVGRSDPSRVERRVEVDEAASEGHGGKAQGVERGRQAAGGRF